MYIYIAYCTFGNYFDTMTSAAYRLEQYKAEQKRVGSPMCGASH